MTWEPVIEVQPIWAQKLLRHIYFEAIDNILEPIFNKESLYIVSYGSAKAKQMAFGWIISTTKGQQLASGHGSCAGRPSSLRGEASGMLYLHHCSLQYSKPITTALFDRTNWVLWLTSSNSSLGSRITDDTPTCIPTWHLEQNSTWPNKSTSYMRPTTYHPTLSTSKGIKIELWNMVRWISRHS